MITTKRWVLTQQGLETEKWWGGIKGKVVLVLEVECRKNKEKEEDDMAILDLMDAGIRAMKPQGLKGGVAIVSTFYDLVRDREHPWVKAIKRLLDKNYEEKSEEERLEEFSNRTGAHPGIMGWEPNGYYGASFGDDEKITISILMNRSKPAIQVRVEVAIRWNKKREEEAQRLRPFIEVLEAGGYGFDLIRSALAK